MNRSAARAARLLGFGLLVSVALWPLWPLASRYWPASAAVGRLFGVWFDAHCQRDPARTPWLLGVPLAVCARCSGIYFGLGGGALLHQPRLTPRALRLWVSVAAALMLADVALERFGAHGAWSAVRVLTGVLLAYPVGAGLGRALRPAPAKTTPQSP